MIDIEAELTLDNPREKAVTLRLFADQLRIYCEAAANVQKNGAVVFHPRTGAPVENPYLKIQAATAAAMERPAKRIKADRTLRLIVSTLAAEGVRVPNPEPTAEDCGEQWNQG